MKKTEAQIHKEWQIVAVKMLTDPRSDSSTLESCAIGVQRDAPKLAATLRKEASKRRARFKSKMDNMPD